MTDPQVQDRTHPQFESLTDQKEMFVQSIHDQDRRQILVLPHEGNQVVSLRTLDVPNSLNGEEQLNDAKLRLLKLVAKKIHLGKAEGRNYAVIDESLAARIPAASGLVLAS